MLETWYIVKFKNMFHPSHLVSIQYSHLLHQITILFPQIGGSLTFTPDLIDGKTRSKCNDLLLYAIYR